jgi:hypothetical protein
LRGCAANTNTIPLYFNRHKIDSSVLSKQVPTIILYEAGKETKRRPTVNIKSIVAPYSFTGVSLHVSGFII